MLGFKFGKAAKLIRIANSLRSENKYLMAALLYERSLKLDPDDAAVHIQCGHMFKEAGDFARAEFHYGQARQQTPNDPDLALQLGHFYKLAGRLQESELAYRRAIELDPSWPEPAIQLAELYKAGWKNHAREHSRSRASHSPAMQPSFAPRDAERERFPVSEGLVPELAPRPLQSMLLAYKDEIVIRRLGRSERTHWGMRRTLRGVDAICGFCISGIPIAQLHATLNGVKFHTATPLAFPLKYERDNPDKQKYVFNIWYNFANFVNGAYLFELHFIDLNGGICAFTDQIVIAAPLSEDAHPNSDRLVSVLASDPRSVEEQINSRPSVIRPAKRMLFPTPPTNVLVQRVRPTWRFGCFGPGNLSLEGTLTPGTYSRFVFAGERGICQDTWHI